MKIPTEFVNLAMSWYSSQHDYLYAVASTGGLSLGNIRPYSHEASRPLTDEEWEVWIWGELECDVKHAAKVAERIGSGDAEGLRHFEEFCRTTAENLKVELSEALS